MQPGEHGSGQHGRGVPNVGSSSAEAGPIARKPRSTAAVAAGAGLQFAVTLVVFVFLGQWLDRRLGTAPVFLLVCVFLGAGGSIYAMYRTLTAAQRQEDEARARARSRRDSAGGSRETR
jgi:F0F1-type ATP synthase assembly protein I